MGIGDVKTGAKWEQERAVTRLTAIAQNLANDLAELAPAFSDLITASASMAAVQSAGSIVAFNARLEALEEHLKQAREDIADLKTRLREVEGAS